MFHSAEFFVNRKSKGRSQTNHQTMALQDIYDEAKKQSKFIKLGDGESFEGKFISVKEGQNSLGQDTKFYIFHVDGIDKTFNSSNFSLLRGMVEAGVNEGDTCRITRKGIDKSTKYEVEKIIED